MSDYTEFFLKSKSSVVQIELLEIEHSNFTQTFRLCRNVVGGVEVQHEDDGGTFFYEYCPMKLTLSGPRDDLDQILTVTLGDLGDIIPHEIEQVVVNDGTFEFPIVRYRTYRSDDLTKPLFGPLRLQIHKVSMNREGAQFEAKAPSLNFNKTGEKYAIARFPMLSGLL